LRVKMIQTSPPKFGPVSNLLAILMIVFSIRAIGQSLTGTFDGTMLLHLTIGLTFAALLCRVRRYVGWGILVLIVLACVDAFRMWGNPPPQFHAQRLLFWYFIAGCNGIYMLMVIYESWKPDFEGSPNGFSYLKTNNKEGHGYEIFYKEPDRVISIWAFRKHGQGGQFFDTSGSDYWYQVWPQLNTSIQLTDAEVSRIVRELKDWLEETGLCKKIRVIDDVNSSTELD
jgi:hypothetical protein